MRPAGAPRTRILLLTRHYPPAVSGGARRPFLFATALREEGAHVDVVAPSLPPNEPGRAVPHAHRDPSGAGAQKRSLRGLAREALLWPDPDIRWSMRAAQAALSLPTPDWVLTTSPPESVHAAGAFLKRRLQVRWVLDFRDHWLVRPHRQERHAPWRRLGEGWIARQWMQQADLVIGVDPVICSELTGYGARGPHVIPHSPPATQPPAALPVGTINIVHTGAIGLSDPACRIDSLLEPFAAAAKRNPQLRLYFAGRLSDAERTAIDASAAGHLCTDLGVVSLEEARALQAGADALIFVASPKMHVPPSKIVEYLTCQAPIIACGSGPWRQDPRTPAGDAVEAMVALRKGDRAPEGRPAVLSARDAARQLLSLMGDLPPSTNKRRR